MSRTKDTPESGLEVHPSDGPEVRFLQDRYHHTPFRETTPMYHAKQSEGSYSDGHRNRHSRPGPCGMGIIAFTGLVTLLTAIVVDGAVGGGLGGALSHQMNENKALRQSAASHVAQCPTLSAHSTLLSTATSASVVPTSTSGIVDYEVTNVTKIDTVPLNCPTDGGAAPDQHSLTGQTYTTVRGQTFLLYCNYHLVSYDIGASVAYTWQDCVESCSSMNVANVIDNATFCSAVTFVSEMNAYYADQHANCWLKSAFEPSIASETQAYFLAAHLIS